MEIEENLPLLIECMSKGCNHVQGITFDTKHEYVYISFTTKLVKADLKGNIIGSVNGLIGHLGCIDYCDDTNKVYGSLEYKHDGIGKGIAKTLGKELAQEDAFYMAVFDVDKIDREDMDAEKDGIMKAAYLYDVVEDYKGKTKNGHNHIYGCSGIDGTAIGREFGERRHAPQKLYVAYGIYSDLDRNDNDCQVLLQYTPEQVEEKAKPLSQYAPHHDGLHCENKLFLYTGNTTYGIQNLEYDFFSGNYYVAVYEGNKPDFPNYSMFIIDGKEKPRKADDGKLMLSLKKQGLYHSESGVYGYRFPYGSTGMYSLGDGKFYFSEDFCPDKETFATDICLYKYNGRADGPFEKVTK